jgi:zinc transporter, ZIP family
MPTSANLLNSAGRACSRCGRERPGDGNPLTGSLVRHILVRHIAAALLPLALLVVFVAAFLYSGPGIRTPGGLPPVERIEVMRIVLPQPDLIVLTVVNSGPEPVMIAQVRVDEAYWRFDMQPAGTIPRLHAAAIRIPYPWVQGEPHEISLVTSTGASFTAVIPVATQTPVAGLGSFFQFALIGLYVGVIPVGLGLMWHPLRDPLIF